MEQKPDTWSFLREHTVARIAMGRAGGSVRTSEWLDFSLAHARARDAVLSPFDPDALAELLRLIVPDVLVLESEAADRAQFLQRPDFGRRLSSASREHLMDAAKSNEGPDLTVITSDGLSTFAAMRQIPILLSHLAPLFAADGWKLGPVLVVRHARVALQDEAGALLGSRMTLMLLGERPGLGTADSLGAYFTYEPIPGRTDADRNCVSNIREGGLPPEAAAHKLHALILQSRKLGLSGVRLKDTSALPGCAPGSPSVELTDSPE